MTDENLETTEQPAGGKPRRWGALIVLLVCVAAAGAVLAIYRGLLPPIYGLAALALVVVTLYWLMRVHIARILLVFFAVLLLSAVVTRRMPKLRPDRLDAQEAQTLAQKWSKSGKFNESLPIVVHLVFDELVAPGVMTQDLPSGPRIRQSLLNFGQKHSMRVFDSVYSRYYYTSDALPHMMNREYLGRMGMDTYRAFPYDEKKRSYSLPENVYFQTMADRGYRTAVFQATYMDFCANRNVDLCETFDSFDPSGAKLGAGLDSPTQKVNLWQTILRAYGPSYTTDIGQKAVQRAYGLEEHEVGVVGEGHRYDVHRFPEWFDRFTTFAANAPRGSHIFAHFLVPHSPYLLLESCVVSGKVDTPYALKKYPAAEREKLRRDYYEQYLAQVGCVARKLDDFMTAIGKSENYRDAVIIIHGDHGSRISISDELEDYQQRDFIDNYAAFFAVRAPGVQPGLDCEFASLPEVFRRYAAARIDPRPRSGPPLPVVVLSRSAGLTKVEAPMPMFGCGAAPR